MGVSRPQKRRDEVPAFSVEDDQRMVDVLPIVAVVVTVFLFSVDGICGCIEVQKHFLRSAVLPSLVQVAFEEDLGYLAARAPGGRVLHPTDGRLAGEIGAALRQRAAGELEQRVFPQEVGVVLVLIATRYLKDALADERKQGVAPLPRSPLGYAFGYGLTQSYLAIHLSQPEKPAVGGDASSVEGSFESEGGMRPVKCVKVPCRSTPQCSLARHQLRLFGQLLLPSIQLRQGSGAEIAF